MCVSINSAAPRRAGRGLVRAVRNLKLRYVGEYALDRAGYLTAVATEPKLGP